MRVAAWVFVVCTVLAAVGVFLPNLEVRVGGVALGHRSSLTLYQLNARRGSMRAWIAAYHRSPGKRVGALVTSAIMPHLGGHVHEALDDATSAMEVLDEVSDDQVRTGSQVFVAVIWAFLGLSAVMAMMIFAELMRGAFRKSRVIGALVLSLLVTPIAIGTLIAMRALVWEANDEVGTEVLAAATGAYVIPAAAIVAFVAAIAMVIKRPRTLSALPR